MINKHTVSLETAKKLKEAGWDKETMFYYNEEHLMYNSHHYYFEGELAIKIITCAPLATEILEELPSQIEKDCLLTMREHSKKSYMVLYSFHIWHCEGESLVEALAETWIYLKKNGLLESKK